MFEVERISRGTYTAPKQASAIHTITQ